MASVDTSRAAQSLALLSHLARVARREADREAADGGLRPAHLVVLTLLRDHGALTQRAIADAIRLDPSTLVGLLNDLEQRGLVARRRDPADRRRHIVELEAGGREQLDRIEERLAGVEDRVLGALDPAERAVLHGLLVRAAGGQLPGGACAAAADPCIEHDGEGACDVPPC
jgi:DNA-binding MarR family transcriptional regulator